MTQDPHEAFPEPDEHTGDEEPDVVTPERVRTGSGAVDEVIRAVAELEERPLEEHVGVFEHAQVQLRRALDAHDDADETEADPA